MIYFEIINNEKQKTIFQKYSEILSCEYLNKNYFEINKINKILKNYKSGKDYIGF